MTERLAIVAGDQLVMSKTQDNETTLEDLNDYHAIELATHTILSNLLDSLHDNFELLHQSQFILLTRLKLIEQRIKAFQTALNNGITATELQQKLASIVNLRKRLEQVLARMDTVNSRLLKIE